MIDPSLAKHLEALQDTSFPELRQKLNENSSHAVKMYLNRNLNLGLCPPALEQDTEVLIDLMKASISVSFSVFIQDIKTTHPEAYITYQRWENVLFRGLGFDKVAIFKSLDDAAINTIIPPQFKSYVTEIKRVQGTPMTNLMGPLGTYALGFTPFILGGVLASRLTEATAFERLLLASAPTAIGGGLRFWSAHQVDKGQGKQAVMKLLMISLGGLCGIVALIHGEDLSTLTARDLKYWGLLFFNALSGVGLANFSASVPLCARAAPDDTLEESRERVRYFTGDESKSHCDLQLYRQSGPKHVSFVGGFGSLTPPVALVAAVMLVQQLGLTETYIIFGAITVAGQCGLWQILQDSVLAQLRHDKVPAELARDLAAWMGQKNQVDPDESFVQKLEKLERDQMIGLSVMCLGYIASFGMLLTVASTGKLTLERRGMSESEAANVIALVTGISALVRSGMALPDWLITPSTFTNASLATMGTSCLVFAFSENETVWLSALFVFAVANGVTNYAVFAQIAEDLSDIVGLASGFAGGTGAFSAIFINVAFASLVSMNPTTGVSADGVEQTKTAHEYVLGAVICLVALMANVARDVLNASRAATMVHPSTAPRYYQAGNDGYDGDEANGQLYP